MRRGIKRTFELSTPVIERGELRSDSVDAVAVHVRDYERRFAAGTRERRRPGVVYCRPTEQRRVVEVEVADGEYLGECNEVCARARGLDDG